MDERLSHQHRSLAVEHTILAGVGDLANHGHDAPSALRWVLLLELLRAPWAAVRSLPKVGRVDTHEAEGSERIGVVLVQDYYLAGALAVLPTIVLGSNGSGQESDEGREKLKCLEVLLASGSTRTFQHTRGTDLDHVCDV